MVAATQQEGLPKRSMSLICSLLLLGCELPATLLAGGWAETVSGCQHDGGEYFEVLNANGGRYSTFSEQGVWHFDGRTLTVTVNEELDNANEDWRPLSPSVQRYNVTFTRPGRAVFTDLTSGEHLDKSRCIEANGGG